MLLYVARGGSFFVSREVAEESRTVFVTKLWLRKRDSVPEKGHLPAETVGQPSRKGPFPRVEKMVSKVMGSNLLLRGTKKRASRHLRWRECEVEVERRAVFVTQLSLCRCTVSPSRCARHLGFKILT